MVEFDFHCPPANTLQQQQLQLQQQQLQQLQLQQQQQQQQQQQPQQNTTSEVLFNIEGVNVYTISQNPVAFKDTLTLISTRASDGMNGSFAVYQMRVGSTIFLINPAFPCLHPSPLLYLFCSPSTPNFVVTFPKDIPAAYLTAFDYLIKNICGFYVPSQKQPPSTFVLDHLATQLENMTSEFVTKCIHVGSDLFNFALENVAELLESLKQKSHDESQKIN